MPPYIKSVGEVSKRPGACVGGSLCATRMHYADYYYYYYYHHHYYYYYQHQHGWISPSRGVA